MPEDNGHFLAGEVHAFLTDVAATMREQGRPASAVGVERAAAEMPRQAATVVVVGEKKRGKSSLINALVGRPDLLPKDVDVATSVHVAVRYGTTERAVVVDDEHPEGREVPFAEIGEYAALDPVTQRPRRDGVHHVEVYLPAPLLAGGLALIDTPGVGGLVAGHTAITLATLAQADALLFVVNGSGELTASELRFLDLATRRVDRVMFVLTQTDRHPGWEKTLRIDRDLVARHAGDYAGAPWFPVSSRRKSDADRAEEKGRRDTAARRYESSGFGALEAALRGSVADRAEVVRLANTVRMARHLLGGAIAEAERRAMALREDPGLLARVRRQRDLLAEHERRNAGWRQRLDRRMEAEAGELRRRMDRRLEELRQSLDRRIAQGDRNLHAGFPAEASAGARGLLMEFEGDLRARLAVVAAGIAEEFDAEGAEAAAVELALPVDIPAAPGGARAPRGLISDVDRASRYVDIGVVVGTAVAALLSPWLAPVVGVTIVAVLSRWRRRAEEEATREADLRDQLERLLGSMRHDLSAAVGDAMATTGDALGAHVDRSLSRARRELASVLEDAEAALGMERDTLRVRRAAADARLERLLTLRERGDDILGRLDE
ncbi:dynamin family protein [Sphaerisporangium aureirubrum]|uniref:Dynamin family protein n=1 Tax=Sphaerisporangium aureirubrum TaxID=1544736 RepID=A0ABW1NPU2_9ACTN